MKTKTSVALTFSSGGRSSNSGNVATGNIAIQGYGFAITPNQTPPASGSLAGASGAIPGDFPVIVELAGKDWQESLLVSDSSAFFFPNRFETVNIIANDIRGGFGQRVTVSAGNGYGLINYNGSYTIYAFSSKEEYMEWAVQSTILPGYAEYTTPLQNWGTADGAGGPPIGNDPPTLGDNGVGGYGVDVRGHKNARIFLIAGALNTNQPAGTGKIELWWFSWISGQWAIGPLSQQYTPQAQTHDQLIAEVPIPVDVAKLYPVANNVANGAASQASSLQMRVELR